MKDVPYIGLFRAVMLVALALLGAVAAGVASPLGFTAAVSAFLTALVFAFVWQVARAGGPILCATAMVVFGLFVFGDCVADPVLPLAWPHATGYLAGVVWAALAGIAAMMGELRILNLRRLHKYY